MPYPATIKAVGIRVLKPLKTELPFPEVKPGDILAKVTLVIRKIASHCITQVQYAGVNLHLFEVTSVF